MHSKHKTEKHKRSTKEVYTDLERLVKYFSGWLKPASRRQPHPYFRCAQNINNTNDPQNKNCLGTVSKNILLEGLNRFNGFFIVNKGTEKFTP